MNRPLDFPNHPDRGDVFKEWKWDGEKWVPLSRTGWAPIDSPDFVGMPTAPTPPPGSNDAKLATTAFVQQAIAHHIAGVASFNGRTGHVFLELQDIFESGGAPLHSPHFTGQPEADTPPPGDDSRRLATTEFVMHALRERLEHIVESWNGRTGDVTLRWDDVEDVGGAPITNPTFFGAPRAPTPPRRDNSTRLATTAFVERAIDDEREDIDEEIDELRNNVVKTWNQRKGHVVFRPSDLSAVGGAFLESPHFTGRPTAPTAPPQTDSSQLATTRYVDDAIRSNPGPPGPPGQRGPQGEPGQGFRLRGSVEDFDDLPTSGMVVGDVWITEDNGRGYVWTGSRWENVGRLQGPPSPGAIVEPRRPSEEDFVTGTIWFDSAEWIAWVRERDDWLPIATSYVEPRPDGVSLLPLNFHTLDWGLGLYVGCQFSDVDFSAGNYHRGALQWRPTRRILRVSDSEDWHQISPPLFPVRYAFGNTTVLPDDSIIVFRTANDNTISVPDPTDGREITIIVSENVSGFNMVTSDHFSHSGGNSTSLRFTNEFVLKLIGTGYGWSVVNLSQNLSSIM